MVNKIPAPLMAFSALLLGLFVCAPATSQVPQGRETQVRWWRGTYEDAFKRAKERNVPVMIVIIQDGEEANERLVDDVIKTKPFVVATESCVAMVTSRKDHGASRQDIDGVTLSACKRLGYVPCRTHMTLERDMYYDIFEGGEVKTPQVLVVLPDKSPVGNVIDVAGAGSYSSLVRKAVRKLGPGFSRADFDAAKRQVGQAKAAFVREAYGEAWRLTAKIIASGGAESQLVVDSRAIQKKIQGRYEKLLGGVDEFVGKGDYWAAFAVLDDLISGMEKTPVGERALALRKKMSKTKEGRKVASALRKQSRYLKDFAAARGFEKKNDYIKAWELYRRIVTRAKGLPIEKRAAERLEVMKKDPDIGKLIARATREMDARDLLREADSLQRKGRLADARVLYKKLAETYPNTKAAKTLLKRGRD